MNKRKISLGPTVKQQDAAMKRIKDRQAKEKRDPLRDNPVVGFMSEEQAERILREMRGTKD